MRCNLRRLWIERHKLTLIWTRTLRPLCGVKDTQSHWLDCPRYAWVRAEVECWQNHHGHDAVALLSHLLPSRSFAAAWKRALLEIPDTTGCFLSSPGQGVQHMFTDGPATMPLTPARMAAWACINASTAEFVAMGYLQGTQQASDRAEFLAVLSAIEWQCHFGTIMHLQCGLTQSLWPMAFPLFFSLSDRRLV